MPTLPAVSSAVPARITSSTRAVGIVPYGTSVSVSPLGSDDSIAGGGVKRRGAPTSGRGPSAMDTVPHQLADATTPKQRMRFMEGPPLGGSAPYGSKDASNPERS